MGGLNDRSGQRPIRLYAHVKVMNADHDRYLETGTVVRIDQHRRRVWVAFPNSAVVEFSNQSVIVVTPRQGERT